MSVVSGAFRIGQFGILRSLHDYFLYSIDIFILCKRAGSRYHTSAGLLGKLGVILA
jgi:hypothetical protein